MIDREARNEVILTVEEYLDDQITAFEFDDRLQEIRSEDPTVQTVTRQTWFYYDDCRDHQVRLSKQEWDYFQRLLLILHSDAELSTIQEGRWGWDHATAWISSCTFVIIAYMVGWGLPLLILAVPFGAVSIAIARYRQRISPCPSVLDAACMPFESCSQIRHLWRHTPGFRKRRFRAEVACRQIRPQSETLLLNFLSYCYWMAFAPVVLFAQGFPSRHSRTRIPAKAESDSGRG